jgi:hypothetical protein
VSAVLRLRRALLVAALVSSVFLLNCFFAITSYALYYLSAPYGVQAAADYLSFDVPAWLGFPQPLYVADAECALLLLVAMMSTYLLSGRGVRGVLLSFQLGSAVLVVLPLEVYFFDRRDFTLFFTMAVSNVAPWFTNRVLLIASATVLAATTTALLVGTRQGRARRRRESQ